MSFAAVPLRGCRLSIWGNTEMAGAAHVVLYQELELVVPLA